MMYWLILAGVITSCAKVLVTSQSIQDGGGNIISSNYVKYKNSKFVSAKGLVTSFQVRSVTGCAEACQKHVACLTFNIIRHGTYKECQLMAPNDVYMMTSDVNYDHYRPQILEDAIRQGRDFPKDCLELRSAGVHMDDSYPIYVFTNQPVTMYCELSAPEAWIRILHREDIIVSFQRGWTDYQSGFGDPSGDHWLGNDLIHNLTSVYGASRLQVDLEYLSGDRYYADYDHFVISDAASLYTLTVSGYSGTAGDGLGDGDPAAAISNGYPFSTADQDNDQTLGNCASLFKGAWWHNDCAYALLTSYFWDGPTCNQAQSYYCILWEPLGYGIPIKKATMKVTTVF